MKTLVLLALAVLGFSTAHAQAPKRTPIGNSGCFLYNYCEPKYDIDYSEDSSKVFTGECIQGDVTYGVICIQLLNTVSDLTMAEDLMISYVDYLKVNFEVKKSVGYGKGHRLKDDENTRGIMDYWEDKDGDKWKIKCWTNGKFIGFMYAYTKKELNESRVNLFLDSFRLPGMK